MIYKPDCRYFNGEKPCQFKRPCEGCNEYSPMGTRILIIKLAAMGDVLRTTPLLSALKTKYPQSHITWVVDTTSLDLLKNSQYIDRLFAFNSDMCMQLEMEQFDLLLSLDKETRAAALAMRMQAKKKQGFGLSTQGNIYPLNPECNYAFQLGIDDDLKFRKNQKSYQQIIFEAAAMHYKGEPYELIVHSNDREYANEILKKAGVRQDTKRIGICPGAGALFANKAWTIEGYVKLIDHLNQIEGVQILLMGGLAEIQKNTDIKKRIKTQIADLGNHHSLPQFSSLIQQCHLLICGDTLPMHLAIGHGKYVLALFGPTCPQEIDLYGRGAIIVSDIECAPCYKRSCDIVENCMVKISEDQVYQTAKRLLEKIKC